MNNGFVAVLVKEVQLGVGDEAAERHDSVLGEVETGHLAVNPDERVLGARLGHDGGGGEVTVIKCKNRRSRRFRDKCRVSRNRNARSDEAKHAIASEK